MVKKSKKSKVVKMEGYNLNIEAGQDSATIVMHDANGNWINSVTFWTDETLTIHSSGNTKAIYNFVNAKVLNHVGQQWFEMQNGKEV